MSSATPASTSNSADNGVAGTAAFSKFMRVLQWVADNPEPVGIAEIAKATGFPRPTVHRIVAALTAERLLVEIGATRSWTLGHRLVQLASRSWSRSGLRTAARDALRALRDETGETVHLAVPSGLCMVYIEKLESPSAVQMASRIGTSVCLHSTAVGKAYLAALAPDAAEPLLGQIGYERQTPQTIADAAALRKQLLDVRACGWSTDAQENEQDIHCFGAAVRDAGGRPVAAVSVSTLAFRQKPDIQASYVAPLLRACAAIGQRLAENPPWPTPSLRRHRLGLDAHGAQHAHDQAADADQGQRLRHLAAQHVGIGQRRQRLEHDQLPDQRGRQALAGLVPAQRAQPRREQADGGHQRQEHFGARTQRHGKGVAGRRHAGPQQRVAGQGQRQRGHAPGRWPRCAGCGRDGRAASRRCAADTRSSRPRRPAPAARPARNGPGRRPDPGAAPAARPG